MTAIGAWMITSCLPSGCFTTFTLSFVSLTVRVPSLFSVISILGGNRHGENTGGVPDDFERAVGRGVVAPEVYEAD